MKIKQLSTNTGLDAQLQTLLRDCVDSGALTQIKEIVDTHLDNQIYSMSYIITLLNVAISISTIEFSQVFSKAIQDVWLKFFHHPCTTFNDQYYSKYNKTLYVHRSFEIDNKRHK